MDKEDRLVLLYKKFIKDLDFTDPIDQEIYILSLNSDFQKAIKSFKKKHSIKIPPWLAPKDKPFYPLSIHNLYNFSSMKDEKSLESDFKQLVQKTRFKNTRYSLSIINGLIFYILYSKLREMKRPYENTPIPPVKIEIKKNRRLGVREVIRITLDVFTDTTEDEVRIAIHEHWKWVNAIQKKLLHGQRFDRPAIKDTVIRDGYFLHLYDSGLSPTEIMDFIPDTSRITLKELNTRISKMKNRVEKSFTP